MKAAPLRILILQSLTTNCLYERRAFNSSVVAWWSNTDTGQYCSNSTISRTEQGRDRNKSPSSEEAGESQQVIPVIASKMVHFSVETPDWGLALPPSALVIGASAGWNIQWVNCPLFLVCPRSGLVNVGMSAIILCHDQSSQFVIIHLVTRQKNGKKKLQTTVNLSGIIRTEITPTIYYY